MKHLGKTYEHQKKRKTMKKKDRKSIIEAGLKPEENPKTWGEPGKT